MSLGSSVDAVKEVGYNSVSFEQFNLTPADTLKKMGESTDAYIMLSPESHDPKISAAAGRGTYTMEQMEEWIPRAMDAGVKGVMVWFCIGMPYQDRQSVMDTMWAGFNSMVTSTVKRSHELRRALPGRRRSERPSLHRRGQIDVWSLSVKESGQTQCNARPARQIHSCGPGTP